MPKNSNNCHVLVVMDDVYAQKPLTEYTHNAGYQSLGVNEARKAAAIVA